VSFFGNQDFIILKGSVIDKAVVMLKEIEQLWHQCHVSVTPVSYQCHTSVTMGTTGWCEKGKDDQIQWTLFCTQSCLQTNLQQTTEYDLCISTICTIPSTDLQTGFIHSNQLK